MRKRIEINHWNFFSFPANVNVEWNWVAGVDVFEDAVRVLLRWEKINFQQFFWMNFCVPLRCLPSLALLTSSRLASTPVIISSAILLKIFHHRLDTIDDDSAQSLESSRSNGNWFSFAAFSSHFLRISFLFIWHREKSFCVCSARVYDSTRRREGALKCK